MNVTIQIAGTLGGAADPINQLDALLALLVEWDLLRDRTRLRSKLVIGGDDADMLTGSCRAAMATLNIHVQLSDLLCPWI